MSRIRVLIADDHPVFRYGLRALLMAEATTMEVVGEATSGEEVTTLAAQALPDVILMDVNMPGLNGIEATRRILAATPQVGILMLTMFDDDESVFAAMRAGARGYLLKGAEGDETIRAITGVSKGEAIFSPTIARRLIGYFGKPPKNPQITHPFPELTEREREILTLIAQGYTNPAIAERLVLSPKTVRNHVSTIFSKLQVAGRAEAIIRARDAGLTKET
ncbi:DNA-binding response regulator [Reticulibacter mediterranei]|uniref:DNA-binding response regulator n=1 Tax=Reticulibacter mediterranei TaxID=2778369 RepID=A0A8J3J0H8_9CHLR|nr:response regulator transcription factor [Reticulibacter mediterranei]GHP00096.1 DNA-binding response regulator [Reticulibacter mediterranei]